MNKKVIIIDDSASQLEILKRFFNNNFWEAKSALNAKDGYDMIFNIAPDLIITDAIMPNIGGLQLVKWIREKQILSEIPIIIYSVINKENINFYLKKENRVCFLNKSDNLNELLNLANDLVKNYQISSKNKDKIIEFGLSNFINELNTKKNNTNTTNFIKELSVIPNREALKEIIIDEEKLTSEFKKIYNQTNSDEKLLESLFKLLFPILGYSAIVIDMYSFEDKKRKLYFDIREIDLNTNFQNSLKEKYNVEEIVFIKKQSVNLYSITNESEFGSKIEFNLNFKGENVANIAIWSLAKDRYDKIKNLESLKNIFFNFFCTRYINKYSTSNAQKTKKHFYNFSFPFLNMFENTESKENVYFSIFKITNLPSIEDSLPDENVDYINLKISQSIIQELDFREHIYKKSKDEYVIMLFAKNNLQIEDKFSNIFKNIKELGDENEVTIKTVAAATKCMIKNEFKLLEAKNIVTDIIENTTEENRIIIK